MNDSSSKPVKLFAEKRTAKFKCVIKAFKAGFDSNLDDYSIASKCLPVICSCLCECQ